MIKILAGLILFIVITGVLVLVTKWFKKTAPDWIEKVKNIATGKAK